MLVTTLRRRAVLGAGMLTAGCIFTTPTLPQGGAGAALPPIPLDGPLRSLGGFEIDAARLGAANLSGIYLDDELVATMVDDRGRWAQARIDLREGIAHRLVPIASGPLRDGAGRPLPRGRAADAESITRLPDGTWLVGYERWHRMRAYRRLDGPGAYADGPPGLDRAPINGGLEGLTLLADGRLFALTEQLRPPGAPALRQAWIGRPGRWMPVAWQPDPGFVPTDVAGLPDGGTLVLERRFTWLTGFAARVALVSAAALRGVAQGGVLAGETILRLDGDPLPAENWEGIAVARHGGRTIVVMVADDNDSRLQRSLMLLFEWRG